MTTSISLRVWADPQNEPDIDIQQIISEGLDRYNESHIGRNPARPIWVVAHNADNWIIGGAEGVVLWSWLYVDWLWAAEEVRGQAVGTQLLSEVERAAAELEHSGRRCHQRLVLRSHLSCSGKFLYTQHEYLDWRIRRMALGERLKRGLELPHNSEFAAYAFGHVFELGPAQVPRNRIFE